MQETFVGNPEWVFFLSAFWQGLGGAFLVSFGVFWAKPYFDNYNTLGDRKLNDPNLDRPFWERFALALSTMLGLAGAVFSIGAINLLLTVKRTGLAIFDANRQIASANDALYWSCVLGAITGIALARKVRDRFSPRS